MEAQCPAVPRCNQPNPAVPAAPAACLLQALLRCVGGRALGLCAAGRQHVQRREDRVDARGGCLHGCHGLQPGQQVSAAWSVRLAALACSQQPVLIEGGSLQEFREAACICAQPADCITHPSLAQGPQGPVRGVHRRQLHHRQAQEVRRHPVATRRSALARVQPQRRAAPLTHARAARAPCPLLCPRPRSDQDAYLGMLGPIFKGEVGDTIEVLFKNKARFPSELP